MSNARNLPIKQLVSWTILRMAKAHISMVAQEQETLPGREATLNGGSVRRHILAVGGDEAWKAFFSSLFPPCPAPNGLNCEVDFACQGEHGVERAKKAIACGRPYMLVFVDGALSTCWDGSETCAKILETDPDLQMVVCAGGPGCRAEEMIRKTANCDRVVVIRKPLDATEVKQMTGTLAGKWELSRHFRESNHRWHETEQCHLFVAEELETRFVDRTAELASTRLRLEHLLRCSPAVVYSLKIGNTPAFTFVSDNFTTIFGHKPEELLAEPEFWTRHLHPDDIAQVSANRLRRFEAGHLAVDFRFKHKDGSYRWVHDDARVIRDGGGTPVEIVGSLIDITDRKRIEEAWREGEKRYRNLIESQGEGVVILDAELRFLFANPAAGELFKLAPEALIGRRVWDYVRSGDHEFLTSQILKRRGGEKSTYELDLILDDRSERRVIVTATPQINDEGEYYGSLAIFRDITERRRAEEKLRLQTTALEAAANGIMITDREGIILWVNPAFTRLTGFAAAEAVGRRPSILKSDVNDQNFYEELWKTVCSGNVWHGEIVNRRKDGTTYCEEMTITPLLSACGKVENFVAVKQDITERKEADKELRLMDMQLRQAQKLEAVGQLAAGIAHEINTPTQYVGDNTRFLKDAFTDLHKILDSHKELLTAAEKNAVTPELLARVRAVLAAADFQYLSEQIPSAINETLEGVERVTKIVRAMKEFSHPGGKEKSAVDINKAIESTVTVARNEWKYVAEMKLELDTNLPLVPCFLGEFNQVILNLVINAAHAIGDVVKQTGGAKGLITISTRCDGSEVEVRVSDTGTGIPENVRPRIFEPFFTTKALGKGTGQGLAIVYGSIVKKHGGKVSFETETGRGTTFILRLPLPSTP